MIRSLAVAILLLTATAPALALEDQDYSAAVAATAKAEIIPAYQTLEQAAESLRGGLDALCKTPSDGTLAEARKQFAAMATAWARIQYISFGPVDQHQRAFRIEYWPDKRNIVGRQLANVLKEQDEAALEPEHFATTTVGVQGLPALDRMLFEKDALADVKPDSFRCGLFAAIGANLATIAHDLAAGWTEGDPSFLARIEHPSEEDEAMPSGRDAAARLLNDLLTATIAMRDMKLLAPLGASLQKAKPQAAEFWRSGQSVAMLKANLQGLRALFGADHGLGGLLAAQPDGKAATDSMLAAIDQASADLAQITLPMDQAVANPAQRKPVETLAAQLARVRDVLSGRVATTLNLPIGFNALDGD
ncbi:MAG TPA: imelysin family protein [Dongiaceae bacterium]|nr:imelysin family protein [Dongiaceae bacterium]